MSEQMAYKMQPAGHDAPPPKRKYKTVDKKLTQAFLAHLKNHTWKTDQYKCAEKALKKLDVSVTAMHALLIAYQEHKNFQEGAGEFASVVYNRVPEKQIIFDIETIVPIDRLGVMLAKNKTLVNRAAIGEEFGIKAEGTIINESNCGDFMAAQSNGAVVNNGTTGLLLCEQAKGVLFNYGFARGVGTDSDDAVHSRKTTATIINYGKSEHVGSYCDSLIVNLNDSGDVLAQNALRNSVAINFGKVNRLGSASKGYVVAAQDPETFGTKMFMKRLVKQTDLECVPELRKYLNNLKAKLMTGKDDYRVALQVVKSLGRNPNIRIRNDIEAILKRAGYE